MSICQILNEKIQSISNTESLDIDPSNYHKVLTKLSQQMKTLKRIKAILEFDPTLLNKIDEVILKNQIDTEKLDINSISVSKYSDITDSTIIWDGDFDTKNHGEEYPNTFSLPPNLKIITGGFVMNRSSIKEVDLSYVGKMAYIVSNSELETFKVETLMYILYMQYNHKLKYLTLDTVTDTLEILSCKQLRIENVSSTTGGKIKIGGKLMKGKHGIYGSDKDVLNKFDVTYITNII